MTKPISIVLKYSLYAVVIIVYLGVLQAIFANGLINTELLILLMMPLVISAYFFNRGKFKTKRKLSLNDNVLSERESEVAGLVAQGIGNKQIAENLFISENTVKTHIKNILTKLALKNRTQIAQWYYENSHHPKG